MNKMQIVQFKPVADSWVGKNPEWVAGSGSPLYLNKETVTHSIAFALTAYLSVALIVYKDIAPGLIYFSALFVLFSLVFVWSYFFHRVVRARIHFAEENGTIQIFRGFVFQRVKSYEFDLPLAVVKYDDDDQEIVCAKLDNDIFYVIGIRCDLSESSIFKHRISEQGIIGETKN